MTRETSTMERTGFAMERGLAWLFGFVAVLLASVGLLRGFGVVGPEGIDVAGIEGLAQIEALQTAAVQGSFWDAMVWMLPAIAAGVLAASMSRADHHHAGRGGTAAHMGAYVMAAVAVLFGVLALLVGFNLFGQGTGQAEGILWGIAAIGSATIASALHAAVPAAVADEDYLVRLVESRVSTTPAMTTTSPAPVPESERPR